MDVLVFLVFLSMVFVVGSWYHPNVGEHSWNSFILLLYYFYCQSTAVRVAVSRAHLFWQPHDLAHIQSLFPCVVQGITQPIRLRWMLEGPMKDCPPHGTGSSAWQWCSHCTMWDSFDCKDLHQGFGAHALQFYAPCDCIFSLWPMLASTCC